MIPSITWLDFTGRREVSDIAGTELGYFDVRINFFPDWFKSLRMDWEVPYDFQAFNPKFQVLVSENEAGPWRQVSTWSHKPYTNFESNDDSKFGKEFYVLQAMLEDGRIFKTEPQQVMQKLPRWQYLRWKEITRREWIALDKLYGIESVVFRRRDFGTRCSYCWNERTGKAMRDKCEHCYGTTYEGGYYTGISTLIQYNQWAGTKQNTYFGKYEPNQLMAWTLNYPTVRPHDIILRLSDFTVFRVEMTQNTTLMTVPTRQIFKLTQLSKDVIENRLLQKRDWLPLRERPKHTHY